MGFSIHHTSGDTHFGYYTDEGDAEVKQTRDIGKSFKDPSTPWVLHFSEGYESWCLPVKGKIKDPWTVQMWVEGLDWLYVRVDNRAAQTCSPNPLYHLQKISDGSFEMTFEDAAKYAKQVQEVSRKIVRIHRSKTGDVLPAAIL